MMNPDVLVTRDESREIAVFNAVLAAAKINPRQPDVQRSTCRDITRAVLDALDDGGYLAPLEQDATR